jgi:hypothetical protein
VKITIGPGVFVAPVTIEYERSPLMSVTWNWTWIDPATRVDPIVTGVTVTHSAQTPNKRDARRARKKAKK